MQESQEEKGVEHFGARLVTLRHRKNFSQEKLSELACVSRHTISNYECGRKIPNIRIAQRISEALGVTIQYLVNGES